MFSWDDPSVTPLGTNGVPLLTNNVVRATCFEVLRASVESRKLFLDGSMCLPVRWLWSGCLGKFLGGKVKSAVEKQSANAILCRRFISGVYFCFGGERAA